MAGASEPITGWLSRVVQLHDWIIGRYGGASGILDESMLRAAIERPWTGFADGTQCFPSVLDKAAVLLERLVNYHPFVDGNKRTATMLTFEFLREQGYFPEAESGEVVDAAVRIAEKKLTQSDIVAWLDRITPVRLRGFEDAVPCPWCGSSRVDKCTTSFAIGGGQSEPGGVFTPAYPTDYWKCGDCQVEFLLGDQVLVVDNLTYLLHMPPEGADPLGGKLVTGPWGANAAAPRQRGSVVVASQDVACDARGFPWHHMAEVVAALRAKLSA